MQILAKFCACSTATCARVRHCNRHKLDAEILQRQNVFAATPAEVLVRCTSTAQKICNEFARFLCENCSIVAPNARFNRRFFSARNTTTTRCRSSSTSTCFRSDVGRSFDAMRVDRAENSQRIREFSGGKKCAIAERAVFSARHTALTCTEAAPTSCDFQIGILAKYTQTLVRRAPKS